MESIRQGPKGISESDEAPEFIQDTAATYVHLGTSDWNHKDPATWYSAHQCTSTFRRLSRLHPLLLLSPTKALFDKASQLAAKTRDALLWEAGSARFAALRTYCETGDLSSLQLARRIDAAIRIDFTEITPFLRSIDDEIKWIQTRVLHREA